MMRLLLLALFASTAAPITAQDADLPPIVEAGFNALLNSGTDAAIDTWTASWVAEEDLLERAQLKSGFRPLWEGLGPAVDFEILTARSLGTHLLDVYAITRHRAQPLYFYLALYSGPGGWTVTMINAHTSRAELFPDWLIAEID